MELIQKISHHLLLSFQSNGFNVAKSLKHSTLLSIRESIKVWSIFLNSILKMLFVKEIPINSVGKRPVSWLILSIKRQSSKNLEPTGLSVLKKMSTKNIKNFASWETTSMEWVLPKNK